ncbi:MAG: glycosyltransferase family 39 protein, partial [Candidatus Gastranaerophilales bacterium]|nr:glycosyltransferase family 39 protein [Candidatus Gastranaerophilales bacterium]
VKILYNFCILRYHFFMDKKKLFFILCLILFLSLGLRFINIDKQEGMWNDEYLTWEIAKAAFPKEFFEAIIRNCHAPLHYLYLKIWIQFFGDTDFSLRTSSLVPGVLSVILMFFNGRILGKKISNSNGLITAGFCAISSFLIYFSQEVRIYSLLFFLSALHTYFALKTIDEPDNKNCICFAISAFLVMTEHTIGFVFIFFSSISTILFANKKKKFKKNFILSLLIMLLLFVPVGIFIYAIMFNQQYFSQWWAPFSFAKPAFFFTDLFSPYLINITNAPPYFWSMAQNENGFNFGFILFALLPLFMCAFCMLKGLFSLDNKVKYFFLTSAGVYLTVLSASFSGKIIFLTKYMTEIYPALILLMICGFASFKDKNLKIILATSYSVICLFFILASNYSPVKLVRTEGQNIPVIMLDVLKYKETDKILFLYYPKERFLKYSPEIKNNNNIAHISKYDFTLVKGSDMEDAYKNGKETYKELFELKTNKLLDDFLERNIFSGIKKGDRFFLVDFAPVTIFSAEDLDEIVQTEQKYNDTPFLYIVFSYIRNYVVKEASRLLCYDGAVNHMDWRIYIFEKT